MKRILSTLAAALRGEAALSAAVVDGRP